MAKGSQDTRLRLLAAALDEFANKGFAGARVDTIAREARINKRMIYHYFGSKRGMWDAVFDEGYWDGLSAQQQMRMQLWKMLASDRLPSASPDELMLRSREIAEMQTRGVIRHDVDPVCVAAIERLVQQASRIWVGDVAALTNPVEQLMSLLTRVLRPRIRVKPRVVSV